MMKTEETTTVRITRYSDQEPWLADAIKRVREACEYREDGGQAPVLERGDLVKVLNAAMYAHINDEIV